MGCLDLLGGMWVWDLSSCSGCNTAEKLLLKWARNQAIALFLIGSIGLLALLLWPIIENQ